jgi:hypothetical protein
MVAICLALDDQVTWPVKSSVAPEEVVPIAMNCVVWVGATDWVPGMMAIEATAPVAEPPLPEAAVTVIVAVEERGPLNPVAEATIVAVPAPTAVTMPEELTVATAGVFEVQDTPLVTALLEAWLALP